MARNNKRSSGKRKSRDADALPTRDEILDYIRAAPDRVGKREIARAFGVKGGARVELKRLLSELADEGLISGKRKRISRPDDLPSVTVIKITGRDRDGELLAEPASWDRAKAGEPPKILLLPDRRGRGGAAGIGDRLLARIEPVPSGMAGGGISHQARTIKRLERDRGRLLGIFRALAIGGGVIDPVSRKLLKEWPVPEGDTGGAEDGELVRFELTKSGRYGVPKVKVVERLGDPEAQGTISLIAIHEHGLRDAFPDSVIQEAEKLSLPDLDKREDLRALPLITIDPADARDHDDAVWAMADDDPDNAGGWIVIVAIADVAWFVRPGSALDKEALSRGNSVYFPDRVVPMLPEIISADLCSLREGEDRACLAVRMVFDRNGDKRSHRFLRGLMRSAAKLTYQQAQDAFDGNPGPIAANIATSVLKPLWGAYSALREARDRRAPLDLDLPERKIILDGKGRIADIVTPPRLEAHRLIEEFMIQANVAAAETLEKLRSPLIYRVHDAPSKEKTLALGDFLQTLDISLPKAGRLLPQHFNRILERAREGTSSELVSEVVLRSQSQAEYSPANFGHFGLNLRRYAHFTSPIRRYADLVVHRALIAALKLGGGGLAENDAARLDQIAESISGLERLAMAAERQTVDRLVSAYLAERIGTVFTARISGVTRSGLFVRLQETGADGFIPASSIIGDFYRLNERLQALIGDDTGLTFQLGDTVEVRLVEAITSAGALRFEMLSDGRAAPSSARRGSPRRRQGAVRRKGPAKRKSKGRRRR